MLLLCGVLRRSLVHFKFIRERECKQFTESLQRPYCFLLSYCYGDRKSRDESSFSKFSFYRKLRYTAKLNKNDYKFQKGQIYLVFKYFDLQLFTQRCSLGFSAKGSSSWSDGKQTASTLEEQKQKLPELSYPNDSQ